MVVATVLFLAYRTYKVFSIPKPGYVLSDLPTKYANEVLTKSTEYVIRNVSVIPMNTDTVLANRNVFISDGTITRIGTGNDLIDTTKYFVIEGTGRFLIPGLNDMHVHINDENSLLLFIANGVTTVRNMAGFKFHLALRDRINTQDVFGPTLFTTGNILEGSSPRWSSSIVLTTKAEAREAVIKCKASGFDFVKVYHTLPKNLYREILQTADSIDIKVVGHIPFDLTLAETISLNQHSLEHIDIRPIDTNISLEVKERMLGESGKWICPTLVVLRNLQRDPDPSIEKLYTRYIDDTTRQFWKHGRWNSNDAYELQKEMTREIFRHGGKFVAGTDCLNPYVLAGFSIHEELHELVNAGLSEYDVLKSATVHPAEMLQRDKDIGTIEPGKIADLVLLGGNPLGRHQQHQEDQRRFC